MPKLVSPEVTPTQTQKRMNGRKISQQRAAMTTTRKRKLSQPSVKDPFPLEDDFIETSTSPLKTPEKPFRIRGSRKNVSPAKRLLQFARKEFCFVPTFPQKAVIRNYKPLMLEPAVPEEDVWKTLMEVVGEILNDRRPVYSSEHIFGLVEKACFCCKDNTQDFAGDLLPALVDVVDRHLQAEIEKTFPAKNSGNFIEIIWGKWKSFRAKAIMICNVFSSVDLHAESGQCKPTMRQLLVKTFKEHLEPLQEIIFSQVAAKMGVLRENGFAEAETILPNICQMYEEVDFIMYKQLCSRLRETLESFYFPKLDEKTSGNVLDFLDYLAEIIRYEQAVTSTMLPNSTTVKFTSVLAQKAVKCLELMDDVRFGAFLTECSSDVLERLTNKISGFMDDKDTSQILLKPLFRFFRLYWRRCVDSVLDFRQDLVNVPRCLLNLSQRFEKWGLIFCDGRWYLGNTIAPMLREAFVAWTASMQEKSRIIAVVNSFAEFVASRAWSDDHRLDDEEPSRVAECLNVFKEHETFETSLRCVAVNHFVEGEFCGDYLTEYLRILESDLEKCDWRKLNSILYECESSKILSTEFRMIPPQGRKRLLSVKVLKSFSLSLDFFSQRALNIPNEIALDIAAFETFYSEKNHGNVEKKLTWLRGIGTCVLTGFDMGTYGNISIYSTLSQAIVLLAFNQENTLTFSQLEEVTGLSSVDLKKTLQELIIFVKLVDADGQRTDMLPASRFAVESKNSINTRKMSLVPGFARHCLPATKVSVLKPKENNNGKDAIYRKQRIDCVIVRIMKSRKTVVFRDLVKEVQSLLPIDVQMKEVKIRMETLMERDIICRSNPDDQEILEYVP